jgi:DUF4097 and DUF4098 domain-containing protein YvlB
MNSNKSFLIGKLIVLIVLLAVIVVLALYFITGNGKLPLAWSVNTVSEENLVLSEEYSGIESVEINTASYAVRVEEYSGANVKFELYCSDKDMGEWVDYSQSGTKLTISQKSQFEIMNVLSATVVVYVPEGSAYDYQINTASGSVKLDAKSVTTNINTASGSVKVYRGGETASVNTVSGSIKLYEPFVTTRVSSTSGSIKTAADDKSEVMDISSVSGSIKIMLDGAKDYTFKATSTSGSVKDEYTGVGYGNRANDTVGGGNLEISAHSTSGSIKLGDWSD